ncbi:MAG: oligosaccharide flippase family protein [Eikenella sp.]|nr:oligosaccharide flippase family protein [Eikenella sp.]
MKIIKDSIIYLFSELFSKALPFLLLPYLTRKLGVAGFGELSYWQTIFSLLLLIFSLSQEGAITRYYYFYGKRNLINVIYASYLYTIFITTITLTLAWLTQSIILAITALAATAQTFLNTQLSIRQCQKQVWSYATIQIASGLSTTIGTILFLELTLNHLVEKRFLAIFIGNIAIFIISFFHFTTTISAKKFKFHLLNKSLLYILNFGLPLILHQASYFIKGQLDRIFIYQNFSLKELGIYTASYQIASFISILLMAMNKAIVPYYYQALKTKKLGKNKVIKLSIIGLLVSPIPATIALFVPEFFFIWLLGEQYNGVHYYIILFLIGFGLAIPYFILINYLFYYGDNKFITLCSLSSSIIHIILLLLLIKINIKLLPLSMIISNTVLLFLLYWVIIKIKKTNHEY